MMDNVKKEDKMQNRQKLDIVSDIEANDPEAKLQIEESVREINQYLDNLKAEGHTGLISPESRYVTRRYTITEKDLYKYLILKTRDDIKEVNNNQYQIIYKNDKHINNSDFEIEPNKPFYQDSEEFKKKKKLTKFLNKSKKVYINPDMFFIPYRYKNDDKFYILVVNNISENIEAYELNSLNYLNKQHNVYDIIDINKDDKIKKTGPFKNYIIRTFQNYVNYNTKELYKIYETISPFKSENVIIKQY